jgi:hypothetical protein
MMCCDAILLIQGHIDQLNEGISFDEIQTFLELGV